MCSDSRSADVPRPTAVDYFVIREHSVPIDATTVATASEEFAPGLSDRAPVLLYPNSGRRYFRVAAVSYTGVESVLSAEHMVDTTARIAVVGDLVTAGGPSCSLCGRTVPAASRSAERSSRAEACGASAGRR